jgi:hypothetical protein
VFEELQSLRVVWVVGEVPFDSFLLVDLLLALEDRVVEVILELLIRKIDAAEGERGEVGGGRKGK